MLQLMTHFQPPVQKKHKIANISKTVRRTKKYVGNIFVQLVERNPTVFIPGRYDQ